MSAVENAYPRAVRAGGNPHAQSLLREVYERAPAAWRGIGTIAMSGLRLRAAYEKYDALRRFPAPVSEASGKRSECLAGLVLQGVLEPPGCPAFGGLCTPDNPMGAPMVSAEGACSAYYRYKRHVA